MKQAATRRAAGRWVTAVLAVLVLAGCATPVIPPREVHGGRAMFEDKARVALLVNLPDKAAVWEYDVERGGQPGGLLQLGIVAAVTSRLNSHAKELPLTDLRVIEEQIAKALTSKGLDVRVVRAEDLKDIKSPRFAQKDGSQHLWDVRPLRARLDAGRLLSVNLTQAGFNYPFSGAIPFAAGDPMAFVQGEAFLVDLNTNSYQWYKKVRVLRGVGKAWDEPPKYPGLTAKYFEVIEIAKEEILDDFLK